MLSIVDIGPFGEVIEDGDVVELTPAGVTLVPPRGWVLLSGHLRRADDRSAPTGDWVELVDDEVSVSVRTRRFPGSADDLLDEIIGVDGSDDRPGPARRRLRLGANSENGVLAEYNGPDDDYIAVAIVLDTVTEVAEAERIGVEVVAEGSAGALEMRTELIESLIASIGA